MPRLAARCVLAIALGLLVSACGGGGGSGGGSTSLYTSPSVNFTPFIGSFEAEGLTSHYVLNSVSGAAAGGTVTYGSTRQVFAGVTSANAASTGADDAQTISLTTPGVAAPSDVTGLIQSNGAKQYKGSGYGTNLSEIALATRLNSSLGATSLSYSFLGGASRTDMSTSGSTDTAEIYVSSFFGGQKTVTSDMPGSGVATYTGAYNGRTYTGTIGGTYSLSNNDGSVSMTTDFGSGTVSGRVDDYRAVTYDSSGAVVNSSPINASLSFSGTVSGNTFSGTASSTQPGTNTPFTGATSSGAVQGGFFGPQAAEAAGALSTKVSTGQSFIATQGVFGAKKN